jgi:hypothetical protein
MCLLLALIESPDTVARRLARNVRPGFAFDLGCLPLRRFDPDTVPGLRDTLPKPGYEWYDRLNLESAGHHLFWNHSE